MAQKMRGFHDDGRQSFHCGQRKMIVQTLHLGAGHDAQNRVAPNAKGASSTNKMQARRG